jgi:hypothetical protein
MQKPNQESDHGSVKKHGTAMVSDLLNQKQQYKEQ